jgi:spore coat polysaccharide biosynthesis protein SpsF
MRVVAIIQARMGSRRLPGKVLMDLEGEPMLARVVTRARRAATLQDVVVATTTSAADDAVARLCADRGWPCFRGSEDDVLDRYERAAAAFHIDVVVRITADCPLIEPALIDRVVREFLERRPAVDYACNFRPAVTFPEGLAVEVLTREALHRAWQDDGNPSWREHVTEYLLNHPELFRLHGVTNDRDHSHLRWTVDQAEDLAFVRTIYRHFGHDRFSWLDVLRVLEEHPDWSQINAAVKQKVVCAIVFRCDGSPSIGMGHVVRSAALATALRERGCDVRFAMRELAGSAGDFVRKSGFPIDVIPSAHADDRAPLTPSDLADTVAAAQRFGARCVVVDHYGASADYLTALRARGPHVGVIDDLADRELTSVDWLLNQNLSAAGLAYRTRGDCVRLLAPTYALLRSEFAAARLRVARTFTRDDRRVLLTFGGGGATERLCAEITKALGDVPRALEVRSALGNADAASMAELMAWADVSINGGGSTGWELCCLGVPMVILTLTPDQVPNAAALGRHGCGVSLGAWHAETGAQRLARCVEDLLADPERRASMSRAAQALVDGGGTARAADSLLALVAR